MMIPRRVGAAGMVVALAALATSKQAIQSLHNMSGNPPAFHNR